MRKYARKLTIIFIVLLTAPLVYNIYLELRAPLLPIWASNLPPSVTLAEQEFNRRVQSQFPVGGNSNDLIASLEQGNFEMLPQSEDGWHIATHNIQSLICNTKRSVIWKENNKGMITDIKGLYALICI